MAERWAPLLRESDLCRVISRVLGRNSEINGYGPVCCDRHNDTNVVRKALESTSAPRRSNRCPNCAKISRRVFLHLIGRPMGRAAVTILFTTLGQPGVTVSISSAILEFLPGEKLPASGCRPTSVAPRAFAFSLLLSPVDPTAGRILREDRCPVFLRQAKGSGEFLALSRNAAPLFPPSSPRDTLAEARTIARRYESSGSSGFKRGRSRPTSPGRSFRKRIRNLG